MTKMIAFMMLFLPMVFAFTPTNAPETCNCDAVSNVEKTGQTSSSISFEWDGSQGATQYKVWFTRLDDQYTSSYYYTLTPAFTFSGLTPGSYKFNIVTVCSGGESSLVCLEDAVQL